MKHHIWICTALLACSLSACNEQDLLTLNPAPGQTSTPTPAPTNVSDLYNGPVEVAPYVQRFIEHAEDEGQNVIPLMGNPKLEIRIASLASYGPSVIGLCERGGAIRRITLSPSFWNSVDTTQRELVTHHELGHCVLARGHRTTLLSNGDRASIMYPVIFSNSMYTRHHAYYLAELFDPNTNTPAAVDDPDAVTTYVCDKNELGL